MSIFEFLERLDADPFDPALDDLFLRRDIQEEVSYDMENGFGDTATITVNPDGTATVKEELIGETKSFSTENQAYTYAYCRGYREQYLKLKGENTMKKYKDAGTKGPYIDRLRTKYPFRICRSFEPEFEGVLVGVQPLGSQELPIYRFPGGDSCEDPNGSGITILEW